MSYIRNKEPEKNAIKLIVSDTMLIRHGSAAPAA